MSEWWGDDGAAVLDATRFGFRYGAANVERVMDDLRVGVVIRIMSTTHPDAYVDVRVSPEGTKVEVVS